MPSLDDHRKSLLEQLQKHQPRTPASLGTSDPYLLTSCLQKALRRADTGYVLSAAHALLDVDPARFWRRLVIVAFEDFGRADLNLTAEIVAAASNKRWRMNAGGDWHAASLLLEKLLVLPRDRLLDDLYTVAAAITSISFPWQPSNTQVGRAVDQLMVSAVAIAERCEQPIPGRGGRSPMASACDVTLNTMFRAGLASADLLLTCLQGRRSSQCLLPVLLPLWLLAVKDAGDDRPIIRCPVPPAREIGSLPSWAYDGYTRLGRAALWKLYERSPVIQQMTAHWASMGQRIDAIQSVLFEVEAGIATESLSHPLALDLQKRGRGCGSGMSGQSAANSVEIVRGAIPELNDIRCELWFSATSQVEFPL